MHSTDLDKAAIFSVPRSGSTWLGQIFNSHPEVIYKFQPNFAYSFEPALSESSTREEIEHFYEELLATKDPFVNGEISISSRRNIEFDKGRARKLIFKETHALNLIPNLLANSSTKIIGLVRSPLSVINSWLKVPKEFDPQWSVGEEWREAPKKNRGDPTHFFGFEAWKSATALFLKMKERYPGQFFLVHYVDLLEGTNQKTTELFNFIDLKMNKQTENFLKISSEQEEVDAYSVFKKKSKDDAWKKELPEFIQKEIQAELKYTELEQFIR